MNEEAQPTMNPSDEYEREERTALRTFRQAIGRHWRLIGGIVLLATGATAVFSLLMTDLYQARSVIIPVTVKESGGGSSNLTALAQQLGGLAGMSLPGSATASEVVSLLKSNVLRAEIVEQYQLLPVLFAHRWDAEGQKWKERSRFSRLFESMTSRTSRTSNPDAPALWDALRVLDDRVKIHQDIKQNTITLTVDDPDPELAALIADHFLETLNNHMSREAKRVAVANRKHLEEQLGATPDPFIRQKTYNMIAQQIEAGMMAEVKENFAFKVIDPPRAPDRKYFPQRRLMLALSLVASLLAAIFVAVFIEYLRKSKPSMKEVAL